MSRNYKRCFITVGTTRFDLLIDSVITASVIKALRSLGCEEVLFQIGNSDTKLEPGNHVIDGVKLTIYRFKDSIQEDIQKADLVISHAGAGSCLEALEARKPLLVVINDELMDNHQLELAEQLQIDGHVYYCTCDSLEAMLETVDFSALVPFHKADPMLFVKYLDDAFKVKQHVE